MTPGSVRPELCMKSGNATLNLCITTGSVRPELCMTGSVMISVRVRSDLWHQVRIGLS
jgi:hypothetical protein